MARIGLWSDFGMTSTTRWGNRGSKSGWNGRRDSIKGGSGGLVFLKRSLSGVTVYVQV